MAFTDEQLERYSRHIILKEVGAKGQKKLLNAKVLIIGAGGLGAPATVLKGGGALAPPLPLCILPQQALALSALQTRTR